MKQYAKTSRNKLSTEPTSQNLPKSIHSALPAKAAADLASLDRDKWFLNSTPLFSTKLLAKSTAP
ncbi:UNVERIFIED_CONTAM: hypothetical protein GTU68_001818 [Idotea baltica]|nr:hypothetical protein [Idotea baltica]